MAVPSFKGGSTPHDMGIACCTHGHDCLRGECRSARGSGGMHRRRPAGQGGGHPRQCRMAYMAQSAPRLVALADALSRPHRCAPRQWGVHREQDVPHFAPMGIPRCTPPHRGGCGLRQGARRPPDAENWDTPLYRRLAAGISIHSSMYWHCLYRKLFSRELVIKRGVAKHGLICYNSHRKKRPLTASFQICALFFEQPFTGQNGRLFLFS